MKHVAIAAVALLVGFLIGGLAPRAEVRDLELQLATAEAGNCDQGQVGRDLALLLGQGGDARPAPPSSPRAEALERPERIREENPEAARLADDLNEEARAAEDEVMDELADIEAPAPEDLEIARTALDLRRAQSRAAVVEDTDATNDQLEDLDEAYGEMNDTLIGLSEELVDMLAAGSEPSRRDAMEFAAEALDAMLLAEERVEGVFDAEQLGALEEDALNPFNYVDPAIVDTLEGLGAAP